MPSDDPSRGRTWAEVANLWRTSPDFCDRFTSYLVDTQEVGIAWETIPVSSGDHDKLFEHASVPSSALGRLTADPEPFRSKFSSAQNGVCRFKNLGGDAELVVPAPIDDSANYAHLLAFLRTAPTEQVRSLWCTVGQAVKDQWQNGEARFWVSTAGLGVHWLHVRLDRRPKYYRTIRFKAG